MFCAYIFIFWHKLIGGLRWCWANKILNTFPQALEAFRTDISYLFIKWLNQNSDVFTAYKESLGLIFFKSRSTTKVNLYFIRLMLKRVATSTN